ncbi:MULTISPECIES: translation elongation factor Ts [Lacrimispora]|uniref:translation elongation factor Ts n=1 Tax=Lacrimispora TaxID=2719231 RepID=UPI0004510578|nr:MULTISPECIES: translation elongation factor Ts [Lacrimispora]EXG86508.1 translation elongation factor Ts (EF-Ts) [Clostridium sp. ASBs410]MDR7814075.1 translation elongation factor Ts [Lacrimispora sp.]SEU28538.1 translation elongation factor Ts (EF-Ts) [Lacrimispora sphenoides]
MAAVTAGMVKELREMTGAGMMDCKKALAETDGDMDKAVEFLREKGLAAASKKAGRIAAEGIVTTVVSEDGKSAAIVEVNSETDFVAKNAQFQTYVADVATQVLTSQATDMEGFLAETWTQDNSLTVAQALSSQIAVIGENMNIRRYEKIVTEGVVVDYIHGGGRIGVLIEADAEVVNDTVKEALKNIAMQIAALTPKYVKRDEIPQDFIDHEMEILKVQAKNENPDKPDNILEKMIVGRLNKELKEFCLVDQAYVKDGDLTVGKYLEQVSKEVGGKVDVKKFVRFETGEGLEKKEENFAEEVARQMQ